MREVCLSTLTEGDVCYLSSVMGDKNLGQKLFKAGFFEGAKIVVLKVSAYKHTFLLDVEGKIVHLRRGATVLFRVLVP